MENLEELVNYYIRNEHRPDRTCIYPTIILLLCILMSNFWTMTISRSKHKRFLPNNIDRQDVKRMKEKSQSRVVYQQG